MGPTSISKPHNFKRHDHCAFVHSHMFRKTFFDRATGKSIISSDLLGPNPSAQTCGNSSCSFVSFVLLTISATHWLAAVVICDNPLGLNMRRMLHGQWGSTDCHLCHDGFGMLDSTDKRKQYESIWIAAAQLHVF